LSIGSWFTNIENRLLAFFSAEDKAIIEFFGPLMAQVKDVAYELGKEDVQAGLEVLKKAALASVAAAAVAPSDQRVAVAETTFLTVGAAEGIKAIHNAEAGAIKAAVAIVQTQAAAAVGSGTIDAATGAVIGTGAQTVGDTILKSLNNE
jgi:hypothetical protein